MILIKVIEHDKRRWVLPLHRKDRQYRLGRFYVSLGIQVYPNRTYHRRLTLGFTTRSYGYVKHFIYGSMELID